ncbi:MAG: carbohydrate-binding protein [Clostridia bacterium]|nr:carbohydrate-binding protein [Clostridia bacterium]
MKKRVFALLWIFVFVCGYINSVCAYKEDYSYSVNLESYLSTSKGVNADSRGLMLEAGGNAEYEFTLEFYSDSVRIESDGLFKITVEIDGYTLTCEGNKNNNVFYFTTPLRIGQKTLKISANTTGTIKGIVFMGITEEKAIAPIPLEVPDFEEAVSSAFIVNENSPMIMVNSAKRYIDYNDISSVPIYHNGSIYLPAKTIADALSCYYEEDKEKQMLVIRDSHKDFLILNNETKIYNDNIQTFSDIEKWELNNTTYLPLRAICELFGKYVLYKDGYIICDYKSRAQIIITQYFEELKKQYEGAFSEAQGNTYFVSQATNASDDNPGTIDAPFKTLNKASQVATAGDTVMIREGQYSEILTPKNSGTVAKPITYKAYNGENVVFTATETISDFAHYKDDIYLAYVPWDMGLGRNQVFYNGKNLVEARYPNAKIDENGLVDFRNGLKTDPVWITDGDLKVDTNDKFLVKSDTLLQEDEDDYWKDAIFVSAHGKGWTLGSAVVKSSAKGSLTVTDTPIRWWFDGSETDPNYGYLTCHVNCIDEAWEWTISKNYLYIKLPPDIDIKDFEVSVKRRQLIADLKDSDNIILDGIKGFGGGIRMNNSDMCVIRNCKFEYISHFTHSLDFRNSYLDANYSDENGAPQKGEMGIYIGGENNAVIGTEVHFSASAGLFIVGSYAFVEDNYFTDCSYMGTYSGAVHVDALAFDKQSDKRGGHTILRNTIKNVSRNAFSVQRPNTRAWDGTSFMPYELAYNDIADSSLCTIDTGMVYIWGCVLGDDFQATKMHHNYVYSEATKGDDILGAIYNDNFIVGTQTYDNLIFSNRLSQFKNIVYEQRKELFPTSYATVDSWNNVDLGIKRNGIVELAIEDFPSGKPFKVGSSLAPYEYSYTYDYYTKGVENMYYAKDAKIQGNVKLDNNRAYIQDKNGQIVFENVDVVNKKSLEILFSGDYYKEPDKYKIYVGETREKAEEFKLTAVAESKRLDDFHYMKANITALHKNPVNIWIEPDITQSQDTQEEIINIGNTGIYGIILRTVTNAYDGLEFNAKKIYCGTFTDSYCSETAELAPRSLIRSNVDREYPITINSWGGSWIAFKDVKVEEVCNKFTMRAASGGIYAGSKIELRVGSPDGDIYASYEVPESNWKYTEGTVDMIRKLDEGIYDFYLTFNGEKQCSDLYWFGLSKE